MPVESLIVLHRTTDGPLMINLEEGRTMAFISRKPRAMTIEEYVEVSAFHAFEDAVRNGCLVVSGVPDDIEEIRREATPKEVVEPPGEPKEIQMEWDDHLDPSPLYGSTTHG